MCLCQYELLYVRKLGASIRRFALGRENQPIAEISPRDIQEYIGCNGWKAATMRSYLVDVKTLFAFALKRKYLRENPADGVDLPRLDDKPPGIVSPDQASAVLDACLDAEPDALAVIALCLFGGLRRAEAEQLEWEEVGADFIEVKAHKAKTRRRRLVPISAQLRARLDCARTVGAQLPAANYNCKLTRTLARAGRKKDWPQNAFRHSFASYHFARHRNENETAAIMGNSPQMVFAHYCELVRPAEVEAFFALLPPADAKARADAVRVIRRRKGRSVPPRTPIKITAEALARVFEDGAVKLPRRFAALKLMEQCDCAQASAYGALSPRGRYWSRIASDAEGLMTWKPCLLATPGQSQTNVSTEKNALVSAKKLPASEAACILCGPKKADHVYHAGVANFIGERRQRRCHLRRAIWSYGVFVSEDNPGMVPGLCRPMAEQSWNRSLVERDKCAALFMTRGKNVPIARGAKTAGAPLGDMLRADGRCGFGQRAQRGFGNVDIQQQLHLRAFPDGFALACSPARAAASCCCIQSKLSFAWSASDSISSG